MGIEITENKVVGGVRERCEVELSVSDGRGVDIEEEGIASGS